jgi:hypothetical protein
MIFFWLFLVAVDAVVYVFTTTQHHLTATAQAICWGIYAATTLIALVHTFGRR